MRIIKNPTINQMHNAVKTHGRRVFFVVVNGLGDISRYRKCTKSGKFSYKYDHTKDFRESCFMGYVSNWDELSLKNKIKHMCHYDHVYRFVSEIRVPTTAVQKYKSLRSKRK